MTDLSENQKSFIKLMRKSEEHARRGFELILKRNDFARFFDALSAEGLFDALENQAPIPVEPPGSVRVPYWPALDYLLACATHAGEVEDNSLAEKVISVVRAVSAFREEGGAVRDNYHTFRRFAEILGRLPLSVQTATDIDLVEAWISSRFDSSGVARALDAGIMKRLLESDDSDDWHKATELLRHCLKLRWVADKRRGQDRAEPITVVDPYWLKELVNHHSEELGRRAGKQSATVLAASAREMFGEGGRAAWSHVFRPAVEDHNQNHSWQTSENCIVDGLRDVMVSWCDVDPIGARGLTQDLLISDVQMLRRIGFYVLSEQWAHLKDLYPPLVGPSLFDSGHMHELYGLLTKHFDEFEDAQKETTLEAIRNIPAGEDADATVDLKRRQRRWLSALSRTTYEPAVKWIQELAAQANIGLSDHPDFNSYMETRVGPGPSPYQVQELVAFAEQGCIAQMLSEFKAPDTWRGASTEAMVATLEQAVMAAPEPFTRILPTFLDVSLSYQQALISGFKRLWDSQKDAQPSAAWDEMWDSLIGFFERILTKPEPVKQTDGRTDSSNKWLMTEIADLLHSGTRDDGHAYPPSLLARAWSVLGLLADRAEPVASAGDDPMTQAINSPKGRIIEALFGHVLRECRLSDRVAGSHVESWIRMKPRFDDEMKKCETGNFEFSTLAGAYIANLDYIDADWLSANILKVFPADRPANFKCALGGLAYSAATRGIYVLLRDAGVLDRAVPLELTGRDVRKKLVERILLGYLWGEETLESARLSQLFAGGRVDDLEAASWFLWSIRGEELSVEQLQKIGDWWEKSVTWAQAQVVPPDKLMSSLGHLAWSIENVTERNRDLLLAVAPYVAAHHSTHEFLGELNRLAEGNPAEITAILGKLVETHGTYYDYQDRLKELLEKLANLGQRAAVLDYCDRLRNVPGIPALFERLTANV